MACPSYGWVFTRVITTAKGEPTNLHPKYVFYVKVSCCCPTLSSYSVVRDFLLSGFGCVASLRVQCVKRSIRGWVFQAKLSFFHLSFDCVKASAGEKKGYYEWTHSTLSNITWSITLTNVGLSEHPIALLVHRVRLLARTQRIIHFCGRDPLNVFYVKANFLRGLHKTPFRSWDEGST